MIGYQVYVSRLYERFRSSDMLIMSHLYMSHLCIHESLRCYVIKDVMHVICNVLHNATVTMVTRIIIVSAMV